MIRNLPVIWMLLPNILGDSNPSLCACVSFFYKCNVIKCVPTMSLVKDQINCICPALNYLHSLRNRRTKPSHYLAFERVNIPSQIFHFYTNKLWNVILLFPEYALCSDRVRYINQGGTAHTGETRSAKSQGQFFNQCKSASTAVSPAGRFQHSELTHCNETCQHISPPFL